MPFRQFTRRVDFFVSLLQSSLERFAIRITARLTGMYGSDCAADCSDERAYRIIRAAEGVERFGEEFTSLTRRQLRPFAFFQWRSGRKLFQQLPKLRQQFFISARRYSPCQRAPGQPPSDFKIGSL